MHDVTLPLHPLRLMRTVAEVLVLNLDQTEIELLYVKHPKTFALFMSKGSDLIEFCCWVVFFFFLAYSFP